MVLCEEILQRGVARIQLCQKCLARSPARWVNLMLYPGEGRAYVSCSCSSIIGAYGLQTRRPCVKLAGRMTDEFAPPPTRRAASAIARPISTRARSARRQATFSARLTSARDRRVESRTYSAMQVRRANNGDHWARLLFESVFQNVGVLGQKGDGTGFRKQKRSMQLSGGRRSWKMKKNTLKVWHARTKARLWTGENEELAWIYCLNVGTDFMKWLKAKAGIRQIVRLGLRRVGCSRNQGGRSAENGRKKGFEPRWPALTGDQLMFMSPIDHHLEACMALCHFFNIAATRKSNQKCSCRALSTVIWLVDTKQYRTACRCTSSGPRSLTV